MKNLPATGKTSQRRKQEKMFGLSKKRRIKNSWKVKAINDVSFNLLNNESLAIVGESGSGKTQ